MVVPFYRISPQYVSSRPKYSFPPNMRNDTHAFFKNKNVFVDSIAD
jgi:hypothetical protein